MRYGNKRAVICTNVNDNYDATLQMLSFSSDLIYDGNVFITITVIVFVDVISSTMEPGIITCSFEIGKCTQPERYKTI